MSVLGPFIITEEDLGCPRKAVDILEIEVMNFDCIVFQVKDDGSYTLGFDYPPYAVDLCITPRI